MQCIRIQRMNTYALHCSNPVRFLRCGKRYIQIPDLVRGKTQMVTKKRSNFCRSAVSLAVAAALPGAVMAQDADSDDEVIEEIISVGIRSSILDSTNTKRNADTISDVIDAGPLGSLPDQSIADALGRAPGVTTIRDSGQSSQLNIRGMNGDFIATTLNGREQPSTAGYSEATRWMSFDQYPAELITQAAVYKSPKASQIEGGVAGIVDLRTVDPLAMHRKITTSSLTLACLTTTRPATLAATLTAFVTAPPTRASSRTIRSASRSVTPTSTSRMLSSSRARGADSQLGYGSRDVDGDGTEESIPRAFQWQGGTGTDERTGIVGTIVFEPNDKIRAQVDYFRSEFDRNDERQGITVGGIDEDEANSTVTNWTIENGLVTGATIGGDPNLNNQSHPWFEARTEDQTTTSDSDTFGLNIEWYPTDSSTLTLDVYTASGEKTREDRIASMHAYAPGGGEALNQEFTYTLNGSGIATGEFSGVDFTDPNSIMLSRYERYPHVYTDDIDSFSVDFAQDVDWGFVSGIEAGVRLSDRTFGADRGTFLYGSRSGQANGWCEDNTSSLACTPQSVAGFVKTQSLPGVPDHFVVTDINGLGNSIFGAGGDDGIKLHSRDWTFIESNDIEEETEAFYLMANLEFQMGNVPVTGNVGIRYVKTDVKTIGLQNVGTGNGTPITDGVGVTQDNLDYVNYGPEYSDTLPSLNLNFELTENDILRVAAAKVIGRPPVGQMKGGAGSWFGGV